MPKAYALGDIHLYECPASWITRETREIIRMVYLSMETGALYVSGGWADQPAWFVEAVEIYRAELARMKKQEQPPRPPSPSPPAGRGRG